MFNVLVIGPVSSGKTWFLNQVLKYLKNDIRLPTNQGRNTNCIYNLYHSDDPKIIPNLTEKNAKAGFNDEIDIEINMKVKGKLFHGAIFYDSPGFEEKDFKSYWENFTQKKIDYNKQDLIIFLTTPEKINNTCAVMLKNCINSGKKIWLILNRVIRANSYLHANLREECEESEEQYTIKTAIKDFNLLGIFFDNRFTFFTNYTNETFEEDFYEKLHLELKVKLKTIVHSKYMECQNMVNKILLNAETESSFIKVDFGKSIEILSLNSKWTHFKIFWYSVFGEIKTTIVKGKKVIKCSGGQITDADNWNILIGEVEVTAKEKKITYKDKLFNLRITNDFNDF